MNKRLNIIFIISIISITDEKTIGITVPAHFTAYISRAFNIGINTRHSI